MRRKHHHLGSASVRVSECVCVEVKVCVDHGPLTRAPPGSLTWLCRTRSDQQQRDEDAGDELHVWIKAACLVKSRNSHVQFRYPRCSHAQTKRRRRAPRRRVDAVLRASRTVESFYAPRAAACVPRLAEQWSGRVAPRTLWAMHPSLTLPRRRWLGGGEEGGGVFGRGDLVCVGGAAVDPPLRSDWRLLQPIKQEILKIWRGTCRWYPPTSLINLSPLLIGC